MRWSPVAIMRSAMAVVFVTGIVGMIVSTVAADNNNGAVVTFGVFAAIAAVSLIAFTFGHRLGVKQPVTAVAIATMGYASADPQPGPADPEALGAQLEEQIEALVAAGAAEDAVRDLTREAVRFGRLSRP
ncbi:MAG: hypothetical protein AB7V43_21480 [Acidimicrobiia bacterium]